VLAIALEPKSAATPGATTRIEREAAGALGASRKKPR
jgi:hypothetical protein